MLLPDIQLATTEQVANFYEVDKTVIYATIHDNKDELISDGYAVLKRNDFLGTYSKQVPKITSLRGAFEVQFSNGEVRKFPHNGIGLFPRRAILRVGMLLRDSKVAKEVRTQLLNIEEKVTVEQKIVTIDEEREILIKVWELGKDEGLHLILPHSPNLNYPRYKILYPGWNSLMVV